MRYEIEKDYRNKIIINLELTLRCNYRCEYCYQRDWSKTGQLEYRDCIKFIEEIQKRNHDKDILVYILGGEALLYKDISKLLTALYIMKIETNITTNGSKSIDWWSEYSKKITSIVLSYHHNESNQDEFFNICKTITKYKHITVNLMMQPKYFNEIYNFGLRLVNNLDLVIVNLKTIRENGINISYTKEQQKLLLENNKLKSKKIYKGYNSFGHTHLEVTDDVGNKRLELINQLLIEEKNRFRGWFCYAGIETFFISHLGEVFGSFCKSNGSMGNIKTHINYRSEPIICDKTMCDCRGDICVTKYI